MDTEAFREKFKIVDALLSRLDNRSDKLNDKVKELQVSLEFSQHEIDTVKEENQMLRQRLAELETEESRSAYQLKKVEEKIDRVDTSSRKRNLIFENVREAEGGKEDIDKTVWGLLDQLNIGRGLELDVCYRVGGYNKNRIVITFMRQSDRDLVYTKRVELRKTQGYKQVWVNEDLWPVSKKTRSMIRMIAKRAQAEGIDCRTGKYSIFIDKQKYSKNNLDELPHPLCPAAIKQV